MNLNNRKILVTGAGGFIGSHLTEMLVNRGYDVRAFVHYNSFNSWGWLDSANNSIKNNIEVIAGDICDPYIVKKAVLGCDAIFHLAALIAIPYSYHAPASYIETNIKGTLNIVQAARECEIEKLVHTSTSEVYGTGKFVPITEEHPLQAQSPYAASKIGADQVAISFYKSFGTPVAIIRPFNTYGPKQSARAIIPTVITQIISGKRKIKLGALSPTRDFNFVEDTVKGFIDIAESDGTVGEVINVGSNFEISIGDTVNLISEIIGKTIEIETDLQRNRPTKSEVERLWADNRKAKELTNWKPKYGGREGFRKGLEKTICWFSDKENLKRYKCGLFNI